MSDIGSPGSSSRAVVLAGLESGIGVAICNCDAKTDDSIDLHASDCPIATAKVQMSRLIRNYLDKS